MAALIVAGTIVAECLTPTFSSLPVSVRIAKVATAILGIVAPVLAAVNAVRARRERLDKDAQNTLLAALAKIVAQARVPTESVGIHAYVVRRRFPWIRGAKQERIARVRLASHPPPSTIEWTKEKGYIGACWQDDQWADFEFRQVYAGYPDAPSEDEWRGFPAKLRFGLSFHEWNNARVYKLVRVYPIRVRGRRGRYRYAGCVSLDTISDTAVKPLLSQKVQTYMAEAAATLGVALAKDG